MPPKYEEKAKKRIKAGIAKYRPILERASQSGWNEADTAKMVGQMLGDLLGYDIIFEVAKEYETKGHYADFAIKLESEVKLFVEVKPVSATLKEKDTKQIAFYSAPLQLEWGVLTNAAIWQCYHFRFGKQQEDEIFFSVSLLEPDRPLAEKIDYLYLLSKEGLWRGLITEAWEKSQALRPDRIASVILSEPVIVRIRSELKKLVGRQVDKEALWDAISRQVIRPDVYEQVEKIPKPRKARRQSASQQLSPTCYAYVPDPDKRSTWKLRYRNRDGSPSASYLAKAVAALSPGGYRGRRVEIPDEHMPRVKTNLRAAYTELGKSEEEIPAGIR